ncbi:MAG TPA: PQQ-dependent sugar dehydrogenase [Acidimicrobiia bacterium]|nr:PQQ-dependent sugar dehydrogenase [Acidimicrobiia bacterium]
MPRPVPIGALLLVLACGPAQEQSPTTTSSEPATTATSATPATTAIATTSTTAAASTTAGPPLVGLRYTPVLEGLPFPTVLTSRPFADGIYFATKNGQVWELGVGVILDISDRVTNSGERGLLGMAWHPGDPLLYLHYSDSNGDTVISEFDESEGLDPSGERIVLQVPQPAANHNGGTIAFGPDGYLWVALGDGGGGGDTFGTGQNPDDLLASLLRIIPWATETYAIPPDNPFIDGGGSPEVWATGLRNPWRFAFDEDLIYIGDVGQGNFEEINVAPSSAPALNYGWPVTEGLHCFEPPQGCDLEGLTLPVIEVAHADSGTCSITGGVVYRGSAIPELTGHYFYSDYCGGWLRSFLFDGAGASQQQDWTEQVGIPGQVVSFGQDATGEIYVLTTESILRIDPIR